MALLLPQGTDTLGALNHALMHRIIAVDSTAGEQSLVINPTNIACGIPLVAPGNSQFGTATQYWKIEQFTEVPGESYPMFAPYSDGATFGNIGAMKNYLIVAGLDVNPTIALYDKLSATTAAIAYDGTRIASGVQLSGTSLRAISMSAAVVDGLILENNPLLRNNDGDGMSIRHYAKRKLGIINGTRIEVGRIEMLLTSADQTTNTGAIVFYTDSADVMTERVRITSNGLKATGFIASDNSTGLTGSFSGVGVTVTVKNGLITAIT